MRDLKIKKCVKHWMSWQELATASAILGLWSSLAKPNIITTKYRGCEFRRTQ